MSTAASGVSTRNSSARNTRWLFLGILLALALLLTPLAAWAGERPVRITLKNEEVVEGRLTNFKERTYRDKLPDGSVRAIREADVRRVEFPPLPPKELEKVTATRMLAQLLKRAKQSGALQARVLGEQFFEFEEVRDVGLNARAIELHQYGVRRHGAQNVDAIGILDARQQAHSRRHL